MTPYLLFGIFCLEIWVRKFDNERITIMNTPNDQEAFISVDDMFEFLFNLATEKSGSPLAEFTEPGFREAAQIFSIKYGVSQKKLDDAVCRLVEKGNVDGMHEAYPYAEYVSVPVQEKLLALMVSKGFYWHAKNIACLLERKLSFNEILTLASSHGNRNEGIRDDHAEDELIALAQDCLSPSGAEAIKRKLRMRRSNRHASAD